MVAAERSGRKIAVEVKSFVGPSPITDLSEALGQYLLYRSWMMRVDPDRILYLAIDMATATDVFSDLAAQVLIDDYGIQLLIVDVRQERIVEWKS